MARRVQPVVLPELNPLGDIVLCKRNGGFGHFWDDAPWPEFLDYDRYNVGYPISERCLRCQSYLVCTYTPRGVILNRYYYHSQQYKVVLAAELTTEDVRIHRIARSKNLEKRMAERQSA